MQLGYIGLGKMGFNMVARLLEKGHEVVAHDPDENTLKNISTEGAVQATSIKELVSKLNTPRTVWIMVPQQVVDAVLKELIPLLQKGDIVIDGGNSPYTESIRRGKELEERGINFLDAGISGGPSGARDGACTMVGGRKEVFEKNEQLFKDISAKNAYGYMGSSGAGHFVKMVHNGIEYGMMQSIAEGFAIMKESDFNLNLTRVADVYNHRSVIESRLVEWLKSAYEQYGEGLEEISGSVSHTGEGKWTVEAAKKLGVPTPIIEASFNFRVKSEKNPSYTGKVLSSLRNQFGGHEAKRK